MLWEKDTQAEEWVTRFTVGEDYQWDELLLPYDVEATRAHAWGLLEIGVLTEREFERIEGGLDSLKQEVLEGRVTVTIEDEDCHTVIEGYLTEELGAVGKKVHTGRSRNDQVLAALRLFLRYRLRRLGSKTVELAEALCQMGGAYDHLLMPGYTHMQQAMPSTAGLWAMGYAETLARDLDVLRSSFEEINVSPLGSAAGYGVPFLDLPRRAVAERLGFRDVQVHVTAVQLSRGKLELQVVHALVQVAGTINRLASDLVLYNTTEFGFVELPEEYCTGSSIMPQKKNPDVLELARAAYHRITSQVQMLMSLPANLPSGYHRDLQHTKAAVMKSVLAMEDLLSAMISVLNGVRFNEERMRRASSPGLFATARALKKVQGGVPFRDAYREAAAEVAELDVPEAQEALDAYRVEGFPGRVQPDRVRTMLEQHQAWIERDPLSFSP